MSEERPPSREHRHEIEIDAPPEAVWRALTDADELTRWYAPRASVSPGQGGTIRLAWGEADQGELRIDAWEPGRRLRLVVPPQQQDGGPDLERPISEEWVLEGRGGRTVLRMVQSDLPATADWDDFYDAIDHGFDLFLATLRHYLHRHPGQPRRSVIVERTLNLPRPEGWTRLMTSLGVAGDGWAVQLPAGGRLSGTTVLHRPERILLATVEQLDDGLLAVVLELQTRLWVNLSAYGAATARLETLEQGWRAWFADRNLAAT